MKKEYKVIALDMDGTLLASDHRTIPQRNMDAIRRANQMGIRVVISTGRMIEDASDAQKATLKQYRQMADYLIGKGVQGLYVGGSSGECIYHSVEERKLVLENVMAVAKGRIFVIAHVACNNTKDSQELAKFLGLSVNSVYTYRNRLKSRAINRDTFEENIRKLTKIY